MAPGSGVRRRRACLLRARSAGRGVGRASAASAAALADAALPSASSALARREPLRARRSSRRSFAPSTTEYSDGSTISVSRVDEMSPPITMIASGCEMKPPCPVMPSAIGSSAKIVASAVIRMGRSRRAAPCASASFTRNPRSRYWFTRSMSTIALVTTMPTSMSTPMIDATPSGTPDTSCSSDGAGRRERHRHQQQQRLPQAAERRDHDRVDDEDGGEQREAELLERVVLLRGDAAERLRWRRPAGRSRRPRLRPAPMRCRRRRCSGVTVTVALRTPRMVVMLEGPSTCSTVARVDSATGPSAVGIVEVPQLLDGRAGHPGS